MRGVSKQHFLTLDTLGFNLLQLKLQPHFSRLRLLRVIMSVEKDNRVEVAYIVVAYIFTCKTKVAHILI